jgi:tetratricopeptide (TPR) repeat protein
LLKPGLLGLVFVKQGKTEDAAGVLSLSIETLQPKILLPIINSKALFELAQIELQKGASQADQAYLEQAVSINPNSEEARLALDQIKV